MSEKITAVLITRGIDYPPRVWERLDLGFFDEILTHPYCPNIYQRYALARRARNEIIYVQDDDCMVNYQVLFSRYNGQLTNAMTPGFASWYKEKDCTLVGWGCFFPRAAIGVFDRYLLKYGEKDPHLLREADRIFTFFNRPFNTVIMPHEDLLHETRMYEEPGHFPSMDEALAKCETLYP